MCHRGDLVSLAVVILVLSGAKSDLLYDIYVDPNKQCSTAAVDTGTYPWNIPRFDVQHHVGLLE